jgi:hypothetical protein
VRKSGMKDMMTEERIHDWIEKYALFKIELWENFGIRHSDGMAAAWGPITYWLFYKEGEIH